MPTAPAETPTSKLSAELHAKTADLQRRLLLGENVPREELIALLTTSREAIKKETKKRENDAPPRGEDLNFF